MLCDMDGTLVDTERSWFATEVSVMADFGYDLGAEHAVRLLGSPMEPAVAYLLDVSGIDVAPGELERRINARMVDILRLGVDLRPRRQAAARRTRRRGGCRSAAGHRVLPRHRRRRPAVARRPPLPPDRPGRRGRQLQAAPWSRT
ncbi:hypothetical protein ACU686_00640 [Yinghuangia aomiensis]